MSKKIKMKRNIEVSGGKTYLGDHEYVLPNSEADPLLADGHAVFVADVADDVKPEAKPEPAKLPKMDKEEKAEAKQLEKDKKAAEKEAEAEGETSEKRKKK